jgi:2,4-diaminopentanoate dehydrogenase
MSESRRALRVVQWTTGNVAHETVRAVLERDDLELVGVYAHSAHKAGQDVADLVGLTGATGILATDDIDTLIALRPDCVVHTPLHFDPDPVARLLRAGINVVTSAEFLTGTALDAGEREAIEAAAIEGGASIFGSGMNPGFASLLAAVGAGISRNVRHVKMSESVDVINFAADANMGPLGWGRPQGDPHHAHDVEEAVKVFHDGLEVLARILQVDDYERRCTVEFAHATEDLDLPGRPIATGTVAGIDIRFEALLDGVPMIELHQRWVMGRNITPEWKVEHGYVVEVAGDPNIRVKLDIWPDLEDLGSLTLDDMHSIGMRITGLPLVNAIPMVCAAAPGIRTYADLPLVAPRLTSTSAGAT